MNANPDQILKKAIKGDRQAYRRLVLDHSHDLFRLAYRLTGNEALADDVVQDAFIKAFNKLAEFKANSSFRTWIHRITVNTAMDHLRKNTTRQRYEQGDFDWAEKPGDCPSQKLELQQQTLAAMEELSSKERAALTLRHYEGHSIQEICEMLQLSTSACKNTIFRAVRKMRAALQPTVIS